MKKNECLKMIEQLSNAYGPSGFEDEPIKVAREYVSDLGKIEEDHIRNLYINRDENTGNKPVIMLDAHNDEVGFMVHSIRDNGTLRLVCLGRQTISSLVSNTVVVRNKEGKYVKGIIASKPVHFMSAAEKNGAGNVEISDLSVDIGATSKKEAIEKYGIRIGEPAVGNSKFEYDEENDVMFGKAFDDRIGVAAVIETMKRLKGESLSCDVKGVLSSQEEVGDRGIKVAVNKINPDIAICFEGCPADDTFTESYAIQTALKKGPMLRFMDVSVICNPRFQRYCLDLAEEYGIDVQASVREGGGNNGAVIQTSGNGTPAVVVGIPVRYIHSANCIASYSDFEKAVELAVRICKDLTKEKIDLM